MKFAKASIYFMAFTIKSQYLITFFITFLAVIKVTRCQKGNSSSIPRRICGEDCRSWMRCNPYADEHIVYTMVNLECRLIKSRCFLNFENCKRAYHCHKALPQITRATCLLLNEECKDQTDAPVCAWFISVDVQGANEFKNFENECKLNYYAWKNEKPYISFEQGKCLEKTT